jgi:hypothetical protein
MKHFAFLYIAVFFFHSLNAQNTLSALEYNNKIVAEQKVIYVKIDSFSKSMYTTKENSTIALNDLVVTIDKEIIILTKLGGYDGNIDFQTKAIDLFKFYKRCASSSYVQIIDLMYTKPMTNEAITKMQNLVTQVSTEEKIYDDAFQAMQAEFAKKHGFTLE